MQNPAQSGPAGASLDWESIFNAIGQPTLILDPEHNVFAANRAALEATGTTAAQIRGTRCYHHFHGKHLDGPPPGCPLQRMKASGRLETVEMELEALGGTALVSTTPVVDAAGNLDKIIHIVTDITTRKTADREKANLEEQLRHAQKMEAIGALAGGVAHDFNNLLSVIMGLTDMLLMDIGEDHPGGPDLKEIRAATVRATELTQQLLTFGKKQVLQLKVLNPNEIIGNLEKMLRRLISENIRIETVLHPDPGSIRADSSQIQQILLNLAINARDAMPEGGRLVVTTSPVEVSEEDGVRPLGVAPGRYVQIAVEDEGTGMSPEIKARAFEPFFTTKKERGTGLGLATVYGIVKQHKGHVFVDSAPGQGTTFRILFPREDGAGEIRPDSSPPPAEAFAGETILVVEDEEVVRRLVCRILDRHGYIVLEAADATEARRLASTHTGPIHLMLTDVVMPGMNGRELYETLAGSRPNMRVLYMSAYTDEEIAHHGILDGGCDLLRKPVTLDLLTRTVRKVLG